MWQFFRLSVKFNHCRVEFGPGMYILCSEVDKNKCIIPYGSESGTLMLKMKDINDFIIADGKWRKNEDDHLQNLVGTSFTKGKFYGIKNRDNRRY